MIANGISPYLTSKSDVITPVVASYVAFKRSQDAPSCAMSMYMCSYHNPVSNAGSYLFFTKSLRCVVISGHLLALIEAIVTMANAIWKYEIIILLRNPVDRAYSHFQNANLANQESINFEKTIICKQCEGTGAKDKSCIKICKTCDGTGVIISIKTFGPGMISQSQTTCNVCRGLGKNITVKCEKCRGTKYDVTKRKINIKLDHSNEHGDKLVIPGEAHEDVDCDGCGDLLLQLNVRHHNIFTRKENNLYMKRKITLSEALCGCDIAFTHMDNRKIIVNTGDIINPETKKKIVGEGLNNGDLVIEFDITFPKVLSKERKEYISKLLPGGNKQTKDFSNYEVKFLENFDEVKYQKTNYKLDEEEVVENEDEVPINCAQQ